MYKSAALYRPYIAQTRPGLAEMAECATFDDMIGSIARRPDRLARLRVWPPAAVIFSIFSG